MIQYNLYHLEVYGVTEASLGQSSAEDQIAYMQGILAIAGADGDISDAEWGFFNLLLRTNGIPEETAEQLRKFDFRGADIRKIVSSMGTIPSVPAARGLLYNAIKMSRADGQYPPEEQAAARAMADALGVDRSILLALEGLIDIEASLRAARLALFYDQPVRA